MVSIPPYPFCILFQIHGSKFKLHQVRYLGQACVSSMGSAVGEKSLRCLNMLCSIVCR